MYKVFLNRFQINLTSKAKVLDKTNTFLLVSIEQKEILKKLRKYKKINLFHSRKPELLKIFKSKIKVIFASGGIVENSKKQILFIHRKGKWDLPKGKAEKNETIRETALREVTEETGIKRLRIRKFYTNTFDKFIFMSSFSLMANSKYPERGSRTCCHGLVAFGFLIFTISPLLQERIQSGIILSLAQSPPPITFPALATPILIFFFLTKKDSK